MSNRMRLSLISISCVLIFYIVLGGVLGRSDSPSSDNEKAYKDLGVYSEVLDRIKSDYVTEPNLKQVTDGAIRGLLEALDPYSTYLSPPQYKDYVDHPEPGPASVGMFLSKRAGFATVISVLPGSPAEKAGLMGANNVTVIGGESVPTGGDIIVSMDDRPINGREDVCAVLAQKEVGDSSKFVIDRRGKVQEIDVVLEELPPQAKSTC